MLKTKTHFEQVPIEIVRKIIEEQIRQDGTVLADVVHGGICQKQAPKKAN
jgi:hypothetical protein